MILSPSLRFKLLISISFSAVSFALPASENPTIEMVEAAYRHHKMHMRYINVEVGPDNLAKAIEGAIAMGWVGFNCSIPNKIEVIQYIDRLAKSAEIIGANSAQLRIPCIQTYHGG